MDAKKIGKFIYQIRTEKRMTQKELAEQINVTDKAVSKWENGEGCPDVSLLPVLSKVLNVEILDLLEGNLPLENTSKKIYLYDFGRKGSHIVFSLLNHFFNHVTTYSTSVSR